MVNKRINLETKIDALCDKNGLSINKWYDPDSKIEPWKFSHYTIALKDIYWNIRKIKEWKSLTRLIGSLFDNIK